MGGRLFGLGIKPPPTYCMMYTRSEKNVMMMGVWVSSDEILCNQDCIGYHITNTDI